MDNLYNATVDLLERNLAENSQRAYLITTTRTWTYGDVIARTHAFAAGLLERGLVAGDRVLIVTKDCAELVVTFWAAVRVGMVAVPLSPALSAADLRGIVDDSGARAIVFDSSSEAMVAGAGLDQLQRFAVDSTSVPGAVPWTDVAGNPAALAVSTRASDIAFWLYTSGTTGKSKAVMHPHANLGATPHGQTKQVLGINRDDVILSVSRMYFGYGLGNSVYIPPAVGASVVVNTTPAIPQAVQALLDVYSPTLLYGVASFWAGYVRLPNANPGPRLRAGVSGGELLRPDVLEAFRDRFKLPLIDSLGTSEFMHHVASNRLDHMMPGSVGRALGGYEAQIRDPEGQRVPDGQRGELWLRGPTQFVGYWNRPDLTARTIVDGWVRTGDVARMEDGYIYHEGRTDDLMKLGGIWVSPREIEIVIASHPAVEEAAVVIADNDSGVPVLKAFVRTRRKDAKLSRELFDACSASLASFKVPRAYELVDELPRTVSGKLRRFELRSKSRQVGAIVQPAQIKPGLVLVLFKPGVATDGAQVRGLQELLRRYPDVRAEVHASVVTEVSLTGKTHAIPKELLKSLPGVSKVIDASDKLRVLGRGNDDSVGFTYNGVRFDQRSFHVFAGLCAVDTREHVEAMMQALQQAGQVTTRMGAYKPRTSPYEFQGLERECLPYVFELAGKYGIRVIAMEVLRDSHIDDIRTALASAGNPTGVMLQIGTRNAQNFELLKTVGQQTEFPVLYKRGMGITLDESLSACEYIASSGNPNIVFCLRGVKTHLSAPHRNLVDFAQAPIVKRLTTMPVCVDPSHSVGSRDRGPDGVLDIMHVTAQGIMAGANMVLVDFHPRPEKAVCDGPQALLLEELELFLEDTQITREAYERRCELAERHASGASQTRRKTPPMAAEPTAARRAEAPAAATPGPAQSTEQLLAEVWQQQLSVERVGRTDNFFSLGGDSLTALTVLNKISERVGVSLPTSLLFEQAGLGDLAALIDRFVGSGEQQQTVRRRAQIAGTFRASYVQARWWLIEQISSSNILQELVLRGSLDAGALEGAWADVVARHASMQTTFHREGDAIMQDVRARPRAVLEYVDLRGRDARTQEYERVKTALRLRRFDLAKWPAFAAVLIHMDGHEHVLCLAIPHILTDRTSDDILFDELGAFYRARATGVSVELPAPTLDYVDYTLWQRSTLTPAVLDRRLDYWKSALSGAPESLPLPITGTHSTAPQQTGVVEFELDQATIEQLRKVASNNAATLFHVALGGFAVLLNMYSDANDIVIGSAVHNRNHESLARIVGCFMDHVPMRIVLPHRATLRDVLNKTRDTAGGALRNAVPFNFLLDALQPPRHADYDPIFQVTFSFVGMRPPPQFPNCDVERRSGGAQIARLFLSLNLLEVGERLLGVLEYAPQRFDQATAQQFAAYYGAILKLFVADPDRAIEDVRMLFADAALTA